MNDLVVPVSIVELDLDELDLGVAVNDLFKQFRSSVIRETEMLDLALFPLLNAPVEAVVFYVSVIVVAVFNTIASLTAFSELPP